MEGPGRQGLDTSFFSFQRDDDDAEALQMRADAVRAATELVRDNLRDYLARNPGASYEAWIASIHPENVEIDARLRIAGNPWLTAWFEVSAAARVSELRCLHGVLALLSALWAGLCIFTCRSSARIIGRGMGALSGMAAVWSIVLCSVQAAVLLSTVRRVHRESWPAFMYKVNVAQLLLQTCATIVALTCFIFNQQGLALSDCLRRSGCNTTLAGEGLGRDVVEWAEFDHGKLSGGPFSSVNITVDRDTPDGGHLPTARLTNGGVPWDGIRIQAAVPLAVALTDADRAVLGSTLVVYVLAAFNAAAYVYTYRRSGVRPGRRLPACYLTLRCMEGTACLWCLLLICMSLWGFTLHPHSPFIAPVFTGLAVLVALVGHWKANRGRRSAGPFNQWQKRVVTVQGVAMLVALTYMAGLCDSIVLCSAARLWPSSLDAAGHHIFIGGSALHLALSAGYAASLWASLYLMKLRSVRRSSTGSSVRANHQLAAPPVSPAPPPAPPAGASRPGVDEASECIVCMDEARDTVLVPCGHLALCNPCARNIMASRRPLCPLCNHAVDDFCRVFRA